MFTHLGDEERDEFEKRAQKEVRQGGEGREYDVRRWDGRRSGVTRVAAGKQKDG